MAATPPMLPTESDVTVIQSLTPLPGDLVDAAMREGLSFVQGGSCTTPGLWPVGCNADLDVDAPETWKQMVDWGEPVTFESFLATQLVSCPAGYVKADTDGRRAEWLRQSFEVTKHIALAKQLWGVSAVRSEGNTPLTLKSAALANTPGAFDTAVNLGAGLSQLVQARKDIAPGPVYIHGPWRVLIHLVELGLAYLRNGRYEGPGFVFVVDEGYPWDNGASKTYLIASGRVEYAWGAVIDNQALGLENKGDLSRYTIWSHRENTALLRIEQQAFVRFDPCGVLERAVTLPTADV